MPAITIARDKAQRLLNSARGILELGFQADMVGICVECEAENDLIEPDASGHECESCGARRVFGAIEIAIQFECMPVN